MFFAALLLSAVTCTMPAHITIIAPEPCFVAERIQKEWPELEARVKLVRETLELPYRPLSLDDARFEIVEHAQEFRLTDGDDVLGLYSPAGEPNEVDGKTTERARIDYARLEEQEYRVILHEMGHYRYNVEQDRYGEKGQGGWFMHGTLADAALQAINVLIRYLWPIPTSHPYWPGLLGQKGELHTNGTTCVLRKGAAS